MATIETIKKKKNPALLENEPQVKNFHVYIGVLKSFLTLVWMCYHTQPIYL